MRVSHAHNARLKLAVAGMHAFAFAAAGAALFERLAMLLPLTALILVSVVYHLRRIQLGGAPKQFEVNAAGEAHLHREIGGEMEVRRVGVTRAWVAGDWAILLLRLEATPMRLFIRLGDDTMSHRLRVFILASADWENATRRV